MYIGVSHSCSIGRVPVAVKIQPNVVWDASLVLTYQQLLIVEDIEAS